MRASAGFTCAGSCLTVPPPLNPFRDVAAFREGVKYQGQCRKFHRVASLKKDTGV
jgi:hypothetical protein